MHSADLQKLLPFELLNSDVFYVLLINDYGNCTAYNNLVAKHFEINLLTNPTTPFIHFVTPNDYSIVNKTFSNCFQNIDQHFSCHIHHIHQKEKVANRYIKWEMSVVKREENTNNGKYILMTGHPIPDNELHPKLILDKRLQDAQQFDILALVAKNITNSVMITNASEEIIWVNDVFSIVNGISLEDIKGKTINFLLKSAHIDVVSKQKIRQALDAKKPFQEELHLKREGIGPIWINIDYLPLFNDKEEHVGFMSIGTDETLRKESQIKQAELITRLSLATDSAAIGIYEIDLVTNEVIWDEKMYALYGYAPDTKMNLFKIFFTSLHPDDTAMMQNILDELISQKKEINGAIYRIILPNGKIKYIDSHAITRKSDTGQVISLIGTNRDITEDILSQEKIKKQNQLLRDIAFSQSHEVRKPLANILAVIEVLKTSGAIEDLEIVGLLEDSAKELDNQIRSIVNRTNRIDDEVFR